MYDVYKRQGGCYKTILCLNKKGKRIKSDQEIEKPFGKMEKIEQGNLEITGKLDHREQALMRENRALRENNRVVV